MPRVVHFEDFASRACPYFLDQPGLAVCRCTHPENEEREPTPFDLGPLHVEIGACCIFNCPLGACLHPETDQRDARLMKRHGFDPKECSDEVWMLLHTEPVAAAPAESGASREAG